MGQGPLIGRAFVYPCLLLALWGPPCPPLGHKRTSMIYSHKNEKSLHGSEVNEFCATNIRGFSPLPQSTHIKGKDGIMTFPLSWLSHKFLGWVIDLTQNPIRWLGPASHVEFLWVLWKCLSRRTRDVPIFGQIHCEPLFFNCHCVNYLQSGAPSCFEY